MSLAKRNDGCIECRQRRVCCDKTEPECLKCRKKGIQCSGQGIECRFSPYMRKGKKATGPKTIVATTGAKTNIVSSESRRSRSASRAFQFVNVMDGNSLQHGVLKEEPASPASISAALPHNSDDGSIDEDAAVETLYNTETALVVSGQINNTARRPHIPVAHTIEIIPAQSRMLFDHFSKSIASKMVVIDFASQGYRQMILPLACRDPTVSQAVSVVAAFHLAQDVPSFQMQAEMGQQSILSKLRKSSLSLQPTQVFNLSAWATVLVLLVGDTITGSNNYLYLLGLLSQLTRSCLKDPSLSDYERGFIVQQTCMFELFGLPLSSESKALELLQNSPDSYLDFMACYPMLNPENEHYSNVQTMKESIRQACKIYKNRVQKKISHEESVAAVESLRQTLDTLDPDVEGCHALVWACFIGGAESTEPRHREFFAERLRNLFKWTRFGTIPVALETLQYLWDTKSSSNWTQVVIHQRPALIM